MATLITKVVLDEQTFATLGEHKEDIIGMLGIESPEDNILNLEFLDMNPPKPLAEKKRMHAAMKPWLRQKVPDTEATMILGKTNEGNQLKLTVAVVGKQTKAVLINEAIDYSFLRIKKTSVDEQSAPLSREMDKAELKKDFERGDALFGRFLIDQVFGMHDAIRGPLMKTLEPKIEATKDFYQQMATNIHHLLEYDLPRWKKPRGPANEFYGAQDFTP